VVEASEVTLKTCHGTYVGVVSTPIHTFYMYRAMGDNSYPMENVNMADIGGVLWYLHNEVIATVPRTFDIKRIVRFKVSVTAPDSLADIGMDFGVRFAYDSQMCTGAGPWNGEGSCDPYYERYGNFVGCNLLGRYPFPMASQGFPVHYQGSKWYSLPKEGACDCDGCAPTGAEDCIYSYNWAGDIQLDDLSGTDDYYGTWRWWGKKEYDMESDSSWNGFWNEKFNDDKCAERVQALDWLFREMHPDLPSDADMPSPDCDFDCSAFYESFEGPPDECNQTLQDQIASWTHPLSAPSWIWPER
jgi:hypothetical protein